MCHIMLINVKLIITERLFQEEKDFYCIKQSSH